MGVHKEIQGPHVFIRELHPTLKEEFIPILNNVSRKPEDEGTLSYLFYEASIYYSNTKLTKATEKK